MKRRIQQVSVAVCVGVLAASAGRAQIPSPRPSGATSAPAAPPAQTSDDSFPSLQRRLADAVRRGDVAGTVALAERQHRLFPNEMKATADLGDAYLSRGDAERAEPLLRAAITQPSKLYTSSVATVLGAIYANLGQIALAKGEARDAIAQLQRAVDYAPTTARPRFLLANAFAAAGDAERSARESRAAFDIDGSAAKPDDFLLLARSLERRADFAAANATIDAGIKRFPSDADLRTERATILIGRKQPAGALCDLLYARDLLRDGDARAADLAARIAKVRDSADSTPSSDDEPTELDRLVSYLDDSESGQFDEALRTIQAVVDAKPFGDVERLLLARAYLGTGRFGEAERVLLDLLNEDGLSLPALVELAGLYYAEGRAGAAAEVVARARAVDARNAALLALSERWGDAGSIAKP